MSHCVSVKLAMTTPPQPYRWHFSQCNFNFSFLNILVTLEHLSRSLLFWDFSDDWEKKSWHIPNIPSKQSSNRKLRVVLCNGFHKLFSLCIPLAGAVQRSWYRLDMSTGGWLEGCGFKSLCASENPWLRQLLWTGASDKSIYEEESEIATEEGIPLLWDVPIPILMGPDHSLLWEKC